MCNICRTKFLYRHHLKLHRCRIRNTKVYHCHLCSETFVQYLSLSHHIRKKHKYKEKKKVMPHSNEQNLILKNTDTNKELVQFDKNKDESTKSEDSGQKILLKITAGKSMTLISPQKEKKSSHLKHKHKKLKKKIDIDRKAAVSVKNGLILTIRPVLSKSESKKTLKKQTKLRTKLKGSGLHSIVEQTSGLKLKIRTDQGRNHIIPNGEAEQKVPKLLVSKRNLENIPKGTNNKQSGSVIASKNIVKKYKNKINSPDCFIENTDMDIQHDVKDSYSDKPVAVSLSRMKNGIIIHKDKLGNYTSAEQIGKTKKNIIDVPKCKEGIWKLASTDQSKSAKARKKDVPKFSKGLWEVMPSPRPDGTPDYLKLRLSPQKPPKLDVNPDIFYESSGFLGVEPKCKDTILGEESDTLGTSPTTDKDLELGIGSVNDSGIEVLSSSSYNRSNGNSVRSVLLDENSPSYFHCEDSLLSFDSPTNDSAKYEHSICIKCGGIIMETNNNTQSPTKCHCDVGSPLQGFSEKPGYIYISPLKDPSVSDFRNNTVQTVPKFKINENSSTFVSDVTESLENYTQAFETIESRGENETNSTLDSHSAVGRSVFDFNEDDDFSVGKPVLDHVKNPLVLNKTEDERKQELIILADLQDQNQTELSKKKHLSSKNRKLSRSPRRKLPKLRFDKKGTLEINSGQDVGNIASKPIVIEDEDENVDGNKIEGFKISLKSKSVELIKHKKTYINGQASKIMVQPGEDEFGLQFKNSMIGDSSEPIIVAIAKTENPNGKADSTDKDRTEDRYSEAVETNDGDAGSGKSDHEQKSAANGQELLSELKVMDVDFENQNMSKIQSEKSVGNDKLTESGFVSQNEREVPVTNDFCIKNGDTNDDGKLQENKSYIKEQSDSSASNGINEDSVSDMNSERKQTCDKDDDSEEGSNLSDIEIVSEKDTVGNVKQSRSTTADVADDIVNDTLFENSSDEKDTAEDKNSELETSLILNDEKDDNMLCNNSNSDTGGSALQPAVLDILNRNNDGSLLQIPAAEIDGTVGVGTVGAASKASFSNAKAAVVMNSDEDSLITIPIEENSDTKVRTPAVLAEKSSLDLFQQQFLSFLSKNPHEPSDSDKESSAAECEPKDTVGTQNEKEVSGKSLNNTSKVLSKLVESERPTPSVELLREDDSDSDFDSPGHSKKRKNACSKENKNETFSNNHFIHESHKRLKRRKSSLKDESMGTDSGGETKPVSRVIIVKELKGSCSMERIEIADSSSDFDSNSLIGKDRKKSLVKKARKGSHVNCAKRRKMHRDFDSDDSDFILSDSNDSWLNSDSDDNLFDHTDPEVNKCKASRSRRDSLKQSLSSINEAIKKDRCGDANIESVDNRSRRSKRGRKSCCPCCVGSPRRSRKDTHQHKSSYKLPKNHEQFIKDTVRLLGLKAKILRLFLSLFPECKELITQSDINTLAFDDLIDDVLSTLKTDVQFEPEGNIFTGAASDLSNESSSEQMFGEHVTSQLPESNTDTYHSSVENIVGEELNSTKESNTVVVVPGIHLMYSDDSVINTSHAPSLEYERNDLIPSNLLPPLPHCDPETEANTFESTESDHGESSVVEKNVNCDTIQSSVNTAALFNSDDNSITLGSELSVKDSLLETGSQVLPVSNDLSQNMPLPSCTERGSRHQGETIPSLTSPVMDCMSECKLQETIPVLSSCDTLCTTEHELQETIPVLTSLEQDCSSQSEVAVNIPNDNQLSINNVMGQTADNGLEEIVITIDLNAAKVQLCKNPKACLKELHSKLVRLVWCLLPELQVSPSVYENLENLEFLIDLIIMSNSQENVETAFEVKSLLSKVGAESVISRSCVSNQSDSHANTASVSDSISDRIRSRNKSAEDESNHFRNNRQNKGSFRKRTKSSEQTSVSKRLKGIKNDPMKLKNLAGDQNAFPKQTKAGNLKCNAKVTKKYCSEKSKAKATGTVIVTKKHTSDNLKTCEKVGISKPIIITRIPNVAGKSQTNESGSVKTNFLFELQLEGAVSPLINKDENSSKNDLVHCPRTMISPGRTPSPDKALGGFSPDSKRRSIDKNIFELLQPTATEQSH